MQECKLCDKALLKNHIINLILQCIIQATAFHELPFVTLSVNFVHSGTKKSTLQLSIYVASVLCRVVTLSDSYHWSLPVGSLIAQNTAHPLPRPHSCYQSQVVTCCICVHIRQLSFTNSVTARETRTNFVNQYLRGVQDGEIAPTLVLCSSEAWIFLSGYVNSQNNVLACKTCHVNPQTAFT